jgi:hypothetical protein
MASMTIRTTVAFDPTTVGRWERLSRRWGVSKSEALRRALEMAESAQQSDTVALKPLTSPPEPAAIAEMSPAQVFSWLEFHSLVTADAGIQWREQVRQTRDDFASRP